MNPVADLPGARFALPMIFLLALAAGTAQAEEEKGPGPMPPRTGWHSSASLNALRMPAFTGSKDYTTMIVPDLRIGYEDSFFAGVFQGIGFNVIRTDEWKAGPILKADFGRDENTGSPFNIAGKKTDALKGMGSVGASPEFGGFAEYEYKSLSVKVEARQSIGNGHDGLVAEAGLNLRGFIPMEGKPLLYMIGPRLNFADSNYNNAYFGVDEKQSARTGLDEYRAGSGIISWGLGAFIMVPIAERTTFNILAGAERLTGAAAKSPLIKERGTVNQRMLMLGIAYEF